MAASEKHPPKLRRSNKERTAEMRGRLIDAAIDTLFRLGYSATTTFEVAKVAGVSKGAMLHHFPTQVDLMLATAEFIVESRQRFRREQLFCGNIEAGLPRFYAAADVAWEVNRRPSTIALLEIVMATRSDPNLGKAFESFLKVWVQAPREAAARMAADLQVKDVQSVEGMLRLHRAAMLGLAIELMFTQSSDKVESARSLLVRYERGLVEALVDKSKKGPRKSAARSK
jgi:AcrR family transcriptional regulator